MQEWMDKSWFFFVHFLQHRMSRRSWRRRGKSNGGSHARWDSVCNQLQTSRFHVWSVTSWSELRLQRLVWILAGRLSPSNNSERLLPSLRLVQHLLMSDDSSGITHYCCLIQRPFRERVKRWLYSVLYLKRTHCLLLEVFVNTMRLSGLVWLYSGSVWKCRLLFKTVVLTLISVLEKVSLQWPGLFIVFVDILCCCLPTQTSRGRYDLKRWIYLTKKPMLLSTWKVGIYNLGSRNYDIRWVSVFWDQFHHDSCSARKYRHDSKALLA